MTRSSIGGRANFRSTSVTADDWRWLARRSQVAPDELLRRIIEMADRLPDAASAAATADGIDEIKPETKAFGARFVDLLAAHASQCISQLKH